MGQYPDGLRGPLIVHDIVEPFPYDEEIILTTSGKKVAGGEGEEIDHPLTYELDWYHDEAPGLIKAMLSPSNPTALPPLPESFLLNDSQDTKLYIDPLKTYKIRIISMAALAATMFSFDSHTMRIIEIDGVYVDIHDASHIRVRLQFFSSR
jgi:iron transport multicopper oxidase